MKKPSRCFNQSVIAVATCLSLLCVQPVIAAASGIDFTDTGKQVEMGDRWVGQPVKHDEKSGQADMVVTLGQQTYPALKDFIARYASQHNISISIEPGSCGVTAKKLRRKAADIGAYCCPPGKTDRLPGIVFHTIGIAPIALVTRPDNPVENLTLQDARDIFSGKVTRWSGVPEEGDLLRDLGIQPVARLHCKKRPGHWKGLLDDQDKFGPKVREVGVIPDMITTVASDKRSIGFETLYMLDVYKEKGELKPLSIDGMHPSDLQNILDASYPFYRTYSLTSWSGMDGAEQSRALIEAIKKHIEDEGDRYGIVPASRLRKAGWKFKDDELVGEPDGKLVFSERQ
jgi:phosphate transport system substrate-binding protein